MKEDSTPHRLLRAFCIVCLLAIGPSDTAPGARAQTPSKDASFDVATIKLVDPSHPFNPSHYWVHVTPAGTSYWFMTLTSLVMYAYDVEPFQVTGPDWTSADHFDIEAKFPEGAHKEENRRMLQTLLRDRFKLTTHIEKRELEGYVLLVGKNGAKLKPSLSDPATPEEAAPSKATDGHAADGPPKSRITKNADGSSTANLGKSGTQTIKFNQEDSSMHFEESKLTMEELARRLSICLGSGSPKVLDETGAKGSYQVAYDCPMPGPHRPASSSTTGATSSDPDDRSSLIRSLDALGLKLEKRKMLTEIYVIDHAERPSEN